MCHSLRAGTILAYPVLLALFSNLHVNVAIYPLYLFSLYAARPISPPHRLKPIVPLDTELHVSDDLSEVS